MNQRRLNQIAKFYNVDFLVFTFYILLYWSIDLIGEMISRNDTNYCSIFCINTIFPGSENDFGKHQKWLLIQNKNSERNLMINADLWLTMG